MTDKAKTKKVEKKHAVISGEGELVRLRIEFSGSKMTDMKLTRKRNPVQHSGADDRWDGVEFVPSLEALDELQSLVESARAQIDDWYLDNGYEEEIE